MEVPDCGEQEKGAETSQQSRGGGRTTGTHKQRGGYYTYHLEWGCETSGQLEA